MGGVQTLIFLSQSGNDEVKVSSYLLYLWSLFGSVHMALDKFSTGFKKIIVCLGVPFMWKHLNCIII